MRPSDESLSAQSAPETEDDPALSSKLPPYVVIEGNSGVGKSTTCQCLARRLFSQRHYPEYGDYVDPALGEELPPFPPQSVEDARHTNKMWPAIDLRRQDERARHAAIAGSRFPLDLVDTSPLSVFAYEAAKAARGFPHDIKDLAERYLRLFDAGKLLQPAAWIFIFAPSGVIYERLVGKGGTREFLFQQSTMEVTDRFRSYFLSNFLDAADYLLIDNGALTPSEQCDSAASFIVSRTDLTSSTTGLYHFVRMLADAQALQSLTLYLQTGEAHPDLIKIQSSLRP